MIKILLAIRTVVKFQIVTFLIGYMILVFVNFDWNIGDWGGWSRLALLSWMVATNYAMFIMDRYDKDDDEDDNDVDEEALRNEYLRRIQQN